MSLNPGVTNPPTTNTGDNAVLVIGISVAVVLMLAIVSVLVYCLWKRKRRDAANAQPTINVPDILSESGYEAPENSAQPAGRNQQQNQELPPVPDEECIDEEPAEYAQLDNSKRAPIDDNYQPLNAHYTKLDRSLNEDVQEYTPLQKVIIQKTMRLKNLSA